MSRKQRIDSAAGETRNRTYHRRPTRLTKKILLVSSSAVLSLAAVSGAPSAASAGAVGPQASETTPGKGRPTGAPTGKPIAGQYIVTVSRDKDPEGVARSVNAQAKHTYRHALNGFAAELNEGQLNALRHRPDVEAVEQDQVVQAAAPRAFTQFMGSDGQPWGLDRMDERNLPLSRSYTYTGTGLGVWAYVIDTGIANHGDFGGRAVKVFDAFGGDGTDCNGHGTHVAGTIGGATYGVAKQVWLRGVRVLDCEGTGSDSSIIAGLDWVLLNHIKPAVANMSLIGPWSSALNTATTNLSNAGVYVAVAAGNWNYPACFFSPASATATYTTAATDSNDVRANFSNYGDCVDGYAPGVNIKSAWLNGTTTTISGTSMASPHVAGVAALYKSRHGDASFSTITSWINFNATNGVVTFNPSDTVNRLLSKGTL